MPRHLSEPTDEEKLACVRRELAFRRLVYPNRIAERRMTGEEAAREIAMMQAIAADYERAIAARVPRLI